MLRYIHRTRQLWADALAAKRKALSEKLAGSLAGPCTLLLCLSVFLSVMPFAEGPYGVAVLDIVFIALALASYFATGLVARKMTRLPVPTVLAASGLAGCTTCGAPVELSEGKGTATCEYCGASHLVDARMRSEMLQAASRRVDLADSESRKAAAGFGHHANRWAWVSTVLLTLIMLALMIPHFEADAVNEHLGGWPGGELEVPVGPLILLGLGLLVGWFILGMRRLNREQQAFDQRIESLKQVHGASRAPACAVRERAEAEAARPPV